MNTTRTRIAAMISVVGVVAGTSGVAMAQQTNDRDRQQQDNRQADRGTMQDRENGWQIWDKETWDDYFGTGPDEISELSSLSDLAGAWRVQVIEYHPEARGGDGRQTSTTGFAERRWVLNGTKLVERYTFDGTSGDLPLRGLRGDAYPPNSSMNTTRDRMDDNRHDAMDPSQQDRESRNRDDDSRERDDARQERNDPASMQRDRDDLKSARSRVDDAAHAQGIVIWGYDTADKEFDVVWTDASTSAIRCDSGSLSDSGTLTLNGEYVDPISGETYSTRTVVDLSSPSRQTITMYRDGGLLDAEEKVREITYTRDAHVRAGNNNNNNNNNNRDRR